jgi:hypothetical protein
MEEKRTAYRSLVRKPEGKVSLGRPRHRWVDIIKMDLGKIGWSGTDCINLDQVRDQWVALVNTVLNLRLQKNSDKFLRGCPTGGLSSNVQHSCNFLNPPPPPLFLS